MNDQQRAAMQMALDVIPYLEALNGDLEVQKIEAITALREALAQPQDKGDDMVVLEGMMVLDRHTQAQPQDELNSIIDKPYMCHAKMTEKEVGFADGWNNLRSRIMKNTTDGLEYPTKFKEKNTPPVVPQGELVARIDSPVRPDPISGALYRAEVTLTRKLDQFTDLYTTPPSVEAMRIETLEKAAKIADGYIGVCSNEIAKDIRRMK